MKMQYVKYTFLILIVGALSFGCAEGDKVFNDVSDNTTRGAVLRQLSATSAIPINPATRTFNPGESFSASLEYQDHEDGNLLDEVEVYIGWRDNTTGGANSIPESLAESIPASSFSTGDRGLPTIDYSIEAVEMVSALGLQSENIGFADQFAVRFEVVLTDGRRFSNDDNSGTITGSYFSSPFLNNVGLECAPGAPTPGTWTVNTNDSYGDGWNGASLSVFLNGALVETIANSESGGNDQTFTFEVPDGTQSISVIYNSGDWDSEVSFNIVSANGNTVVNTGPNPSVGTELLNFCLI